MPAKGPKKRRSGWTTPTTPVCWHGDGMSRCLKGRGWLELGEPIGRLIPPAPSPQAAPCRRGPTALRTTWRLVDALRCRCPRQSRGGHRRRAGPGGRGWGLRPRGRRASGLCHGKSFTTLTYSASLIPLLTSVWYVWLSLAWTRISLIDKRERSSAYLIPNR